MPNIVTNDPTMVEDPLIETPEKVIALISGYLYKC